MANLIQGNTGDSTYSFLYKEEGLSAEVLAKVIGFEGRAG